MEVETNIEAAEMWLYRRILKISWREWVSTEQDFNRAEAKKKRMVVIRRKQLRLAASVLLQLRLQQRSCGLALSHDSNC